MFPMNTCKQQIHATACGLSWYKSNNFFMGGHRMEYQDIFIKTNLQIWNKWEQYAKSFMFKLNQYQSEPIRVSLPRVWYLIEEMNQPLKGVDRNVHRRCGVYMGKGWRGHSWLDLSITTEQCIKGSCKRYCAYIKLLAQGSVPFHHQV